MRNPSDICKSIKKVVPKEHHPIFDWLIEDFSYKSPEQTQHCWHRLSEKCNNLLGDENPPKTLWKRNMIEILIDKPLPSLS
tara:strand:- start:143 stop:385 length:243 start_codon:yes stop_codon:yes gene_type:complete